MAERIDYKLEEKLKEIGTEVDSLPNREGYNLDLRRYEISNAAIKRIIHEENGPSIAELTVTIMQQPLKHVQTLTSGDGTRTKRIERDFEDWHSYWMIHVVDELAAGKLSMLEKAVLLQEFIANLKRNFNNDSTTERILKLTSKLHDKLAYLSNARDEKEYTHIRVNAADSEKKSITAEGLIYAVNMRKTIHLKPENYEKIKKHEAEGKFDSGIPLKMDIVAYVVLD